MESQYMKKSKLISLVKNKLIVQSIMLSSLLNIVLLVNFKNIRSIFPPPEIGRDGLVGFAQYFGYPFYFDTLIFFFMIFVPISTFIVLYIKNRKK